MDIEVTGTSSEIVEQLATITYGDHIVLIYPNQYSFREIYSCSYYKIGPRANYNTRAPKN